MSPSRRLLPSWIGALNGSRIDPPDVFGDLDVLDGMGLLNPCASLANSQTRNGFPTPAFPRGDGTKTA